ncbi:hypothetical protein [Actinokineospora terrae]|uniref:hypothetical protein n=1 Tax=Actinokineospora terrae TaxID=155974 RepID=UPI0015A69C28|nr:hypothetical protein [Actinokineospora terrae]
MPEAFRRMSGGAKPPDPARVMAALRRVRRRGERLDERLPRLVEPDHRVRVQ